MAEAAGERRIVSALLVDIADSTKIGEQLGRSARNSCSTRPSACWLRR
jgi:hypothetical protein